MRELQALRAKLSPSLARVASASLPRPGQRVRFGSLADISERTRDVRFTPKSGHADVSRHPKCHNRHWLGFDTGRRLKPIQKTPAAGKREDASGLKCYAWNLSISGSLLRAKAMRSTGTPQHPAAPARNTLPHPGDNLPKVVMGPDDVAQRRHRSDDSLGALSPVA